MALLDKVVKDVDLNAQIAKTINLIDSGATLIKRGLDFDIRFLSPEYWKQDQFNNLTNTWVTFYIDNTNLVAGSGFGANVVNTAVGIVGSQVSERLFSDSVTVFGVSINIHKSPRVIETQVKGFGAPVFTQFASDSYDITIEFTESGPIFWQQNSIKIASLVDLLNSSQTLSIANPQLNLIYGIDKTVVLDYTIGQDASFYNNSNISISLKSDTATDILIPKKV